MDKQIEESTTTYAPDPESPHPSPSSIHQSPKIHTAPIGGPVHGVILPTSSNLLTHQTAFSTDSNIPSSTQKSHPSDNDIIQQMEQDWASENGTNILDENFSGFRSVRGSHLLLVNSQYIHNFGTMTSKYTYSWPKSWTNA